MFHISDGRYVQLVRDPAKAHRAGYSFSESLTTFDEAALREELGTLGFDEDQTNAAIHLARLKFVPV